MQELTDRQLTGSKPIIVFDVDGVIFEYDGWHGIDHYGKPMELNIELINFLYDSGDYEVAIWTTRTNPHVQGYPLYMLITKVTNKLLEAGVKYHKILREPKPLFSILVDDNAVNLDLNKLKEKTKIVDSRIIICFA